MQPSHEATFRAWLRALEQGAPLAQFFAPDVRSHELPNLLFPAGAERDAYALQQASERGKQVVREQRIEVNSVLVDGDQLAARMVWSATLRVSLGARPEGSTLRCSIAAFLRFRDGLIVEHWTYDCYHAD